MEELLDEIECASDSGDMETLVRLYVDEKFKNIKMPGRCHPLQYSFINMNEDAMHFLIQKCAYVEELDVDLLVTFALCAMDSTILSYLIEKAGPGWICKKGRSFLHISLCRCLYIYDIDIILKNRNVAILSGGVNPFHVDLNGESALHYVARLDGVALSKNIIYSLGISYVQKNIHHQTPYDIAKKSENQHMVGLIEEKYADDSRAFSDFQIVNLTLPSTKRLPPDIVRVVSEYVFILDIPQDDEEGGRLN